MAHFSIISSQGQHPVIFTGAPRYVGAYLKPGYLEFPEIGSPTAIGWHVGDYVVYSRTGRTYRLYGTPKATEQSDANKYGAAFLYENVQFFDDMKQWELCPFKDLVPGDNTVHFSTQGVVSFFGKPSNVAERLQACLENQYGTGSWEVRIVDTSDADLLEILNTEVEFSVSGVNCLQVLDKVYDTWNKLGWAYTIENGKNILTIGAPNDRTAANTTEAYSYDNGLVAVEKSIANATEIGTRLFAYGSMKNMDATYYRGLDIYQAESVDIEHLMIPISYWGTTSSKPDARKAYIQDASAIAKMGVIPRTAYFDGTGDLPDIHPTIERMTIGEVYDAGGAGYLPDLSKWSRNQRIDEIISANNPSDEGAASDMGVRFKESISGTLDAVTEVGQANDYIEPDIFTTTLTKSGRLVLKFGRNAQTITINSAWDARFNVATLEVSNGSNLEVVPLKIVPVSSTSFTFVLPEQVVIQNAVAGTLRVGLNIFVLDNAPTAETDTVTIGIDGTTTIEGGVVYMLDKTFSVTIPQIGFDIEKYAELGNGKKISMKTGMCAGRDFEIKEVYYQSTTDRWVLTLYRSNDEDLNILFPNVDYPIAAGDQFVLLDIAMPEMYVTVASQRLLEAAQKLLADICEEKPFYAPQIDAKTVIDESRVLLEGLWMDISFNGAQEYALIDSITIDENGSNIPTYDVALRQEKGLDWTENIGSASSGKSSVSVSGNESIDPKGTVTSVGLTAPEGMEVDGSPVTGAGILELKLAQGYKIPLISELAQYFELGGSGDPSGLVKLKAMYDLLGVGKGVVFNVTPEADVADSSAHLMLRNMAAPGDDPEYALYTPFHLITGGDQIVQNGTPGGGGGGGGSEYLWELLDVDDNLQSPAAGALLQYDSVAGLWKGNAPATQIGVGVTGFTTGALIRNVLGDDFNAQWSVKQFINSSIATATATFRGTNTTATTEAAFLTWANGLTHDLNDYVFWKTTDSLGNTVYKRYKYDGSQWVFEYELNNSSFTSEQWDAINSGITSGKVSTYDTIAGYFSGGKILSTALPAMYIGDAQVKFSAQTAQDVGGLGQLTMANAKYLRAYNTAGDTLYNLAGLNASNYGYLGAANSPRTYMRGKSLYFLSGDSGNTSALVISTSQNATFYGALYLQNNKQIYWKNKPAEGAGDISIGLLNLTSSNVFTLGSGLIATGDNARAYNTYIYGASLSFYTGNSTNGATRRWMINSSGSLYPYADKSYNLGAAQNYVKEAYIGKMFLAPGVYIEYVPASGDTPGYVHISSHLLTDGDQIVKEGVPGGGGGGGSEYLWELLDVDSALITPSNGVVLQYNATAGKWKGVASDTIGITAAGSVADLNAASPSTAKKVWSPSVLASWLSGKNYVENVAIGTGANAEKLAVTRGGSTSYLTVPYATNVVRFKRYEGTLNVEGGYDLNTLLAGGGITSQYNLPSTWGNAPTNMSYGGAVQLNPRDSSQLLAMQLAWDIDHTNVKTGKLWWRDSIYKNSTHTWGAWHLIYDDTTLTKSVITGLLDAGNGTYVKLNPGSAEQTISSNISSLEKGVVNLWRKSGDHFTFLGFSNGTTETYLGGIGFKSQSDHNLYRKDGSNYYKIWDEANSNLASVNWACKDLSAAGNITLANNKFIRWMSNPAAGASPEAIIAIEFTTSNNLHIGYGVAVSGHYTRLYGNTIDFLTGSTTRTTAFVLSDSDAKMYRTFVPSINNRYDLGSSELKWGTLHANNGNFYNKVNIGSPSFSDGALNVNGAIVSSGDQVVTSDIRMKKNLKPIELKVEDIAKCRAVTFDWVTGGHSFGSIAQDWLPILPEAVKQGDTLGLAYAQLATVGIITIAKHETEQDKEIRRLRERVADLEKEVKRLRA